MQFVRFAAPLFVSFAVACGAADAAQSSDGTDSTGSNDNGTTTTNVKTTHGSSSTSTTDSANLGESGSVNGSSSGSTGGAAVDPTTSAPVEAPFAKASGIKYRGVNLSGASFGSALPGILGKDYGWPTHAEVDYFTAKGMNTFRVDFMWERMQPKANGDLDATYAAAMDDLVAYATSHGANVVLNPQNFAKYYGSFVGSSAVPNSVFADFWHRMAQRYANNIHVMFGLMNEPHDLPTEQWVGAANAAIAGIRSAGATNLIHVPGVAWTGAHAWSDTYYGTPNAVAMLDIVDPGENYDFEVHQYLDDTSGGIVGTCSSKTAGTDRLNGFLSWLRANGKKGFVAEFAGGNNSTCNAAVTDMLQTMTANADVLNGWLWWGAGPRWTPGYPFAIDPTNGNDAPQMALLAPYLP